MKMLLTTVILGCGALLPLSASAATGQDVTEMKTVKPLADAVLTLTVENIKKPKGFISAGLYQGQAGYEGGQRLTGELVAVEGNSVTLTFKNVPVGEYGIKLIHDVDGDGKMDTGLFGIPSEPYAFSNSARGSMGPAKWDKAKFNIAAGANSHVIRFKK